MPTTPLPENRKVRVHTRSFNCDAVALLRTAPSHPLCPDVNGSGEKCDWCLAVDELLKRRAAGRNVMGKGPPQFRRAVRPVPVNGVLYNYVYYDSTGSVRLLFQPKRGGYRAGSQPVTSQMVTTLEELKTQYGLRTAVLVRTALLTAGYKEVV